MSYYEVLGLNKEPFSTSPDPAFFYRSSSHNAALQRLEILIRLKRGLGLILGDVGIGKTTMSRALVQSFANDHNYIFHIMLDPSFKSEFQFLSSIAKIFGIRPDSRSTLDYREEIQRYLFRKGVDENKTVVLLIDEGQKLSAPFLEILRIVLNYETNEHKLLQLVIVAQMELLPRIKKIRNFYDRIGLKYIINPLDVRETIQMISFRLKQAGLEDPKRLFTEGAMNLIYEYSQGYPRKTLMVCHDALEFLVMTGAHVADEAVVKEITNRIAI